MELYIHIPFCMRKCLYCDFLSDTYDTDIRKAYTEALCREIVYYGRRYNEPVETVFIGGGTPSWLELPLMEKILSVMRRAFTIERTAEITIECNPGTLSKEAVAVYAQNGVNRISIGLQSANDDELALLGRVHTFNQFLKTYEAVRNAGYSNINVDIMTGLPGQTPQKLEDTLKRVIMLKPTHISAYDLMIEEGTPFFERYHGDVLRRENGQATKELPTEDEAYNLTKMTEEILQDAGYRQYEISNFAKPKFVCRHNIGYWRRVPYLGVGLGAASFLNHMRFVNERDIYRYIENAGREKAVFEGEKMISRHAVIAEVTPLSLADEMAEFMFLGLRMNEGFSRKDFESAFDRPIEAVYGDLIHKLCKEEWIGQHAGRIFLTEKGRDVANPILAQFLPDEEGVHKE